MPHWFARNSSSGFLPFDDRGGAERIARSDEAGLARAPSVPAWRRCVIALVVSVIFVCGTFPRSAVAAMHVATAPVTTGTLQLFATEVEAQKHCPTDEVVWLNTNSGIWHEKGMRWYGRTKAGAYVCKREAATAGDRDTRNGQ